MSYPSFDTAFVESRPRTSSATLLVRTVPLGPLEAFAVAVGMRDGLSSLNSEGRLARWTRRLFGLGPSGRLADPRLESLRRLAVAMRLRPYQANAEIAAARRAGVSEGQIAAVSERVRS